MRVSAEGFRAPKLGNKDSEYEDAFYPRAKIISQEQKLFSFAVADGATETSFSGLWAKQLVRAFCKGIPDGPEISINLVPLRERWQKIVSRRPLPWYAEEKIRSGAFAAIVGLVLEDGAKGQGSWKALAVGDSCLFQVRNKQVLKCFPIKKSEDFNNSPQLLSSIDGDKVRASRTKGQWLEGDTFYLMTDAVACWFMKQVEVNTVPARELTDLRDDEGKNSFQSWLKELRDGHRLRNDDVTIVRIEIEKD
jgi:serine/threonine protein phosphatase PrpC